MDSVIPNDQTPKSLNIMFEHLTRDIMTTHFIITTIISYLQLLHFTKHFSRDLMVTSNSSSSHQVVCLKRHREKSLKQAIVSFSHLSQILFHRFPYFRYFSNIERFFYSIFHIAMLKDFSCNVDSFRCSVPLGIRSLQVFDPVRVPLQFQLGQF